MEILGKVLLVIFILGLFVFFVYETIMFIKDIRKRIKSKSKADSSNNSDSKSEKGE